MNIEQQILRWDGKSSGDIALIYQRFKDEQHFAIKLITLSRQLQTQTGATWLLKHFLEDNRSLTAQETESFCSLLFEQKTWQARLHLLQCLPYIQIETSQKQRVEVFLRNCLDDENKFVRTWAYNGFYEISLRYPKYKKETKRYFEMAMRDEAPSVKARIRNILKTGF